MYVWIITRLILLYKGHAEEKCQMSEILNNLSCWNIIFMHHRNQMCCDNKSTVCHRSFVIWFIQYYYTPFTSELFSLQIWIKHSVSQSVSVFLCFMPCCPSSLHWSICISGGRFAAACDWFFTLTVQDQAQFSIDQEYTLFGGFLHPAQQVLCKICIVDHLLVSFFVWLYLTIMTFIQAKMRCDII